MHAESALLSDVASETARTNAIKFANIRETAGWSKDAAAAGPKMAALLAAAAEPMPDVATVKLESGGVILIYGRDQAAVEAGKLLKDHLDVTVLIAPGAHIVPGPSTDFPIAQGKVHTAKGHLGTFEITVDNFAKSLPSSRDVLLLGRRATARGRTAMSCSIYPAAQRCFPQPTFATDICALILAIRKRS